VASSGSQPSVRDHFDGGSRALQSRERAQTGLSPLHPDAAGNDKNRVRGFNRGPAAPTQLPLLR
jgi:hypothetical protein